MHDITIGVLMLCDIRSVNFIWFLRPVPKFLTKNILKIVICATQTCSGIYMLLPITKFKHIQSLNMYSQSHNVDRKRW